MVLQKLCKNHYNVRLQRLNKLLQNLERRNMQKAYKHNSDGQKLTSMFKWLPLYIGQYIQ